MSPARLPEVGDLVAAKYRITAQIGGGGYGVVYRAHQETMGRDVAIKMLRPEAATKPDEIERFRREVFNASCLRHPNTITLYDYGQTPAGSLYIVMEHLEGMDLGEWLQERGRLEHDEALGVLEQILKSLREAHNQGILHRDLKPENVFLSELEQGELLVKVLDFGLSKAIGGRRAGQRTLTKDGQVHGTPHYMSPEQACAMKLTPASDIYGVGLLTWEMLTGRSAYTGATPVDILLKQVNEPTPELPSPLRGTLLDEFIHRATLKDQHQRLGSGAAALEWLEGRRERDRRAEIERTLRQARERPAPTTTAAPDAGTRGPTQSEPWFALREPASLDVRELELRLAQLPMIGRQGELKELLRWGQQAMMTGGVLWVTGEGGVGKSRLVEEWLRHMSMHSVAMLRGGHREDGSPLEGLHEALAPLLTEQGRAGLHLPERALRGRLIEDLRRVLEPESIQTEDPAETTSGGQDWALATIEHALYALAGRRPVILLLEDVHRADSFTQRLVERWEEEMATRAIPLVLVFTARAEGSAGPGRAHQHFEHIRSRGAARTFTHAYDLRLGRLAQSDADGLLEDLFPFTDELRDRIIHTARGNPLYLTQIVRYLVEEELLARPPESERWGLAAPAQGKTLLPPDMEALLVERVRSQIQQHRLSAVLEALLLRALLLGMRFEVRLLKEMLRQEGRGDLEAYLDDALEAFHESGILVSTLVEGRPGLEFGYELLRASLLEDRRWPDAELDTLHAQAARAKRAYFGERDPRRLDMIAHELAHHWEAAGDAERAFEWLIRAARAAERAQDFRQALDHLRRASDRLDEHLDPNGEHLLEIRLAEGRMFRFLGEYGSAEDALREAIEETQRVGDVVGEALTGEALAGVLALMTRYEEARQIYDHIEELYDSFAERAGVLRCELGHAELARFEGDYPQARARFEAILEQALELEAPRLEARCIFGLGQCDFAAGRLEQAARQFRRARKRAERLEDALLCSEADIELATVALFGDHIELALSTVRMALETKQSIGDTLGQAHAHLILGMSLRRTHRLEEASFQCKRARALYERLNHIYGIAKAVLLEAEIAWVVGEPERALRALEDTRQLHDQIGDAHGEVMTELHRVVCELDLRHVEQAREALARAEELIDAHDMALYRPKLWTMTGMVHEARGEFEEAVALHDEALQLADQTGHTEMAAIAAINLAKAHMLMGDLHAVRREAPGALRRAEATGHTHAMLFALTLSTFLARLDRDAEALSSTVRRLRVLHDNAHQINLRIPDRLASIARTLRARLSLERAFPIVLSIVELMRTLGDTEGADELAGELLRQRG